MNKLICLLALFILLGCKSEPSEFTIVVIPDTQKLSSDEEFGDPEKPDLLFNRMKEMAGWIIEQKDSLNIVMVSHLGDMTEDHDVEIQWRRNVETWEMLNDAGIPFTPCHGNHDSLSSLNKFFPLNDFVDKAYWGASMGEGIENAFYLFSVRDIDFVLLVRQYGPDEEVDAWANDIFTKYSDRRGIFISHSGMSQMKGGMHHVENIVQKHDNIFMAHMGHIMKNEGNEYWTSLSPSGNIQHILRANYQKRKEETLDVPLTAMLRYYTFQPDENIVNAFTYNVTMNKYYRDKDHQFSFSYNMDNNAEME